MSIRDSRASISGATTTFPASSATASARAELAGRVLVVAGSDDPSAYPRLLAAANPALDQTGLVVGGSKWSSTVRGIRNAYPGMFLICDPSESEKHFATKNDPFPYDEDPNALALIAAPTLNERLDAQLHAGASIAMTPTGYIQAGDRDALKAVITDANKLNRDDTVAVLPLAYQWLAGKDVTFLLTAINRSHHPLAISLGDASGNPMSRSGVLDGVRALAASDAAPMFHKTDLGGLEAMSFGALASGIGVIASKRRAGIPGTKGFAPRVTKGANVLLHDLARFRRSLDMQDQWYASINPPTCPCLVCKGRPIDRFGRSNADCLEASKHNALAIIQFAAEARAAGGFRVYWPDRVNGAISAHTALGARIGTKVEPPKELKAWANRGTTSMPVHP